MRRGHTALFVNIWVDTQSGFDSVQATENGVVVWSHGRLRSTYLIPRLFNDFVDSSSLGYL